MHLAVNGLSTVCLHVYQRSLQEDIIYKNDFWIILPYRSINFWRFALSPQCYGFIYHHNSFSCYHDAGKFRSFQIGVPTNISKENSYLLKCYSVVNESSFHYYSSHWNLLLILVIQWHRNLSWGYLRTDFLDHLEYGLALNQRDVLSLHLWFLQLSQHVFVPSYSSNQQQE